MQRNLVGNQQRKRSPRPAVNCLVSLTVMVKGNAQVNDESLTGTGKKFERLRLVVEGNKLGSCPTIKHVSQRSREHKIRKSLSLCVFS